MKTTLRLIGKAIRDGSVYLPIRNRAAALATLAEPKDYLGQLNQIYKGFVDNWRYVKDPYKQELVTTSPEQIWKLVIGGRSEDPGVGLGRGAGDCDDAAVALGAMLRSIGFPVRLAVTAPPGVPAGPEMAHVFVQAYASPSRQSPGGWTTVDPVPLRGMGFTPKHSRMAIFDLNGRLKQTAGNSVGLHGTTEEVGSMRVQSRVMTRGGRGSGRRFPRAGIGRRFPRGAGSGRRFPPGIPQRSSGRGGRLRSPVAPLRKWHDFSGLGDYSEPEEDLLDFDIHGIKDWGAYASQKGIIDLGDCGMAFAAEVDEDDEDERGYVWTPMLEFAPDDYDYIASNSMPYTGMLALGDNGAVYEYDGNLGFFKKLFKKAKKKIKRAKRRIKKHVKSRLKKLKKIAKKLIKKIPGGKFLLKFNKKLWKISKKLVKPLMKALGPLAKIAGRIAPVAALIPGYGTAIAAALAATGKIAKLMKKTGTVVAMAKGSKIGKLRFKSGALAKKFTKLVKKAAKAEKRKRRRRRPSRPGRRRRARA